VGFVREVLLASPKNGKACVRCGAEASHYCKPCSGVVNRIIDRWMDGGDLPAEELAAQLGMKIDALNQRMIRLRRRAK
jgi:hypothetical protein